MHRSLLLRWLVHCISDPMQTYFSLCGLSLLRVPGMSGLDALLCLSERASNLLRMLESLKQHCSTKSSWRTNSNAIQSFLTLSLSWNALCIYPSASVNQCKSVGDALYEDVVLIALILQVTHEFLFPFMYGDIQLSISHISFRDGIQKLLKLLSMNADGLCWWYYCLVSAVFFLSWVHSVNGFIIKSPMALLIITRFFSQNTLHPAVSSRTKHFTLAFWGHNANYSHYTIAIQFGIQWGNNV